jgi:5-formyltetrahydrofolate cyclo-ligase
MSAQTQKQELRRTLLAKRQGLTNTVVRKLSHAACERLQTFVNENNPSTIFLYFPVNQEVDLRALLTSQQRRFAFPVIDTGNLSMQFYYWNLGHPLRKNGLRIDEPIPSVDSEATPGKNDLIVVPALAADRSGYRLGYGKGYYDRYLAQHPGISTVTVVFSDFLVEQVPRDQFDVRLDHVITDQETFVCAR